MTTGIQALTAAATSPGAGESFLIRAVQLLILLALLVVVIGVPTMIVLLARKQKASEPGSINPTRQPRP